MCRYRLVAVFTMQIVLLITLLVLSLASVAENIHPEDRLLDAVYDIQVSDLQSAEEKLRQLIVELPDFKLAQLVYADVLTAKVTGVAIPAPGIGISQQKEMLLQEIKNRYQADQDLLKKKKIPAVLARLDQHYENAIVVDLNRSRLYVFDNNEGIPVLVNDFFVSMGRGGAGKFNEGDLKTPLGVYFVTNYISPRKLADKYGAGAYPINYPNAWDKMNGRTGHGIWLHGTRSGTYNRPLLASEGCVVLPNEDLLNVGSYIDLKNTPVLIGEGIEWLEPVEWKEKQQQINAIHQQWKSDWESLDVDRYLRHYSSRFTSGNNDIQRWAEHKRRISRHKTFVSVELSNVSLLLHPNEDVLVATYLQSYSSDNFSSRSWKRQYWNREHDGQWRIVFEDEISQPGMPQLARSSY